MGLNGLTSSVRQLFVEASPTVEKAVSCYKADQLVALLLSFRSIQSLANFVLQGKNAANEATDGCVQTFDARCCVAHQTYIPSDSLRENLAWWVVTQRTLKNHKAGKIGGWVLARVWALAQDNTVIVPLQFLVMLKLEVDRLW